MRNLSEFKVIGTNLLSFVSRIITVIKDVRLVPSASPGVPIFRIKQKITSAKKLKISVKDATLTGNLYSSREYNAFVKIFSSEKKESPIE